MSNADRDEAHDLMADRETSMVRALTPQAEARIRERARAVETTWSAGIDRQDRAALLAEVDRLRANRSDVPREVRAGGAAERVRRTLMQAVHEAGNPQALRERLGRIVREVWVEWAREQPSPKASWLVPWEGLNEPDREVDRRIGERLFAEGRRAGDVPAGETPPSLAVVIATERGNGAREEREACARIADARPTGDTPATLTREEARERLLALGFRLVVIDDMIARPARYIDGSREYGKKARAILRAYVAGLNAQGGAK